MDESRIEHLKMLQAVITRMAQNSFQLKGWAIVLWSALLGFAAAERNAWFVLVAYLPTLMFWFLDAYYLRQERLFRKIYDHVRSDSGPSDFSMNTSVVSDQVANLGQVALSQTVAIFYGAMLIGAIAVTIVIR